MVEPVLAHALCDLVLREKTLVDEHAIGFGFFDGVEIFPLDIFDQRELHHFLIRPHIHHNRGHDRALGLTRSAKPPLARDQLIARSIPPHGNGLENALLPNRLCQFAHGFGIEIRARLMRIRFDLIDGDFQNLPMALRRVRRMALRDSGVRSAGNERTQALA